MTRGNRVASRGSWRSTVLPMLCLAIWMILPGCRLTSHKTESVALPARHSLKAEQLLVLSDFKLKAEHPLIVDLGRLRRQVSETLQLPLQTETVVVYLFNNEVEYRQYMHTAHPRLPFRRAFFIARPEELAVYTFWGERIQEDLRHEYTHGLLHACLTSVPMWLDEGLAEYFEVAGATPGGLNAGYAERLTLAVSNGWKPDLPRLEQLEEVDQMQRADYREAWAWVHYMLESGNPDTKSLLLTYLQDLRIESRPIPLSKRLAQEIPNASERLLSYIAALNTIRAVEQVEYSDGLTGRE